MRIVIASTYVPFSHCGERKILGDLKAALQKQGHQVEIILLPIKVDAVEATQQQLAIRLLDVNEASSNSIDRLITIQPSSCALQHDDKVAWLLSTYSHAYDLWGAEYEQIPPGEEARCQRDRMIRSDSIYLREAGKLYTSSKWTADRLEKYNNLSSTGILYPPLLHTDHLQQGEFGDYFVYPGILNSNKRLTIAIRALNQVHAPVGLVLFGSGDDPVAEQNLRELVGILRLEDRVKILKKTNDQEKANWIAGSCGVINLDPEDGLYESGILEAFHCHKPVVTACDSVEYLEVIREGITGRVVAPDALRVGEAIKQLWCDKPKAADLGHEGFDTLRQFKISWDHITEHLAA